ncbi:MAG: hypothetical protein RL660_2916, partial [Bacteroidota bacterium]
MGHAARNYFSRCLLNFSLLIVVLGYSASLSYGQNLAGTQQNSTVSMYELQATHILSAQELGQLSQLGVQKITYQQGTSYYIWTSVSSTERINQIHSIRPANSTQKIDKRLNYLSQQGDVKEVQVLVTLIDAASKSELVTELQAIGTGAKLINTQTIGENTCVVQLLSTDLNKLANTSYVEHITPLPEKDVPLNNVGIAQMNVGYSKASAAIGGRNLSGLGITIGVGDDADVQTHADFDGRLLNFNAAPTNYHGSITTGQAAGSGMIQPRYEGVLPQAQIISSLFSNVQSYTPKFFTDYHMTVTNNSYATVLYDCNNHGIYDGISKSLDKQCIDYPFVSHVFAAGNDGLVQCPDRPLGYYTICGQYQSAKNIIIVGNLQNNDTIYNEASRGPSFYDKRIRPDVVALGVQVQSCGPNDIYTPGWGSSMSSPFVAGVVGLLHERYKQVYNSDITSDLAKALVLNGATDLGTRGPDYTYGFGRINAERSMRMLETSNFRVDSVANGDSLQIGYFISNTNIIVKSMLYYHDIPGEPNVYPSLVNDLDITLTSPSGKVYYPFVLDPTDTTTIFKAATTGRDSINNMEQIQVNYPEVGLWQYVIKAKKVVSGKQRFVLVMDTIQAGLHLRYPVGGEHLTSNTSTKEPIMWDVYDTIGYPVNIQYSNNGGNSWVNIISLADSNTHQYYWNAASSDSNGLIVRINANGQTVQSKRSAAMALPTVTIGAVNEQCPGYCRITWSAVPGATGYYVYQRFGNAMKLVDSTVSTTNYIFKNLGTTQKHYFAIRARKYHLLSEQSTARSYIASGGNCTLNTYNFDLQARSIASATVGREFTSSSFTGTDSIKVVFTNSDNFKCDSFKVDYQVGTNPWQTTGTLYDLNALASYTLGIGAQNFATPGSYNITAAITNIAKTDPLAANDTIRFVVRQLPNALLALNANALDDGFESNIDTNVVNTIGVKGNDRWDITHSTNKGRARTFIMKDFAHAGNKALTLDASIFIGTGNTNSAVATYNLSNESINSSDIRLSLYYKHHGQDTSGGNDNAIYVRGADSLPWLKLYDLLENQAANMGEYKHVIALKLSRLLKQNGQPLTSSTQIKFTQSGRFKTGDNETLSGYTFDDLSLFKVYNDLATETLVAPQYNACKLGSQAIIKAQLSNNAQAIASNVTASYQVNDGAWVTETIASMPADSTITYSFQTPYNFSVSGRYKMRIAIHQAGDSYRSNDTIVSYINAFAEIASLPYVQTFEDSATNFFMTDGVNSSWQWGTPSNGIVNGAASGTKAWKTNLQGKYNDNELSYLVSPCINITTTTKPWLSWHMSYDIEDCGTTLCDAAWLEVSGDGKTWVKINPDSIAVDNKYLQYFNDSTYKLWKGKLAGWHSFGVALPKNLGNSIQFRFVLQSDPGVAFDGLAIDDVHVYDNATPLVTSTNAVQQYLQNVNSTSFIPFIANNQIFASLNTNGNALGNVIANSYYNNGPIRTVNAKYFLDRNYVIQPESKLLSTPANVRLYFLDADYDKVIADTTCATCVKPSSIFDLSVLKYSTIDPTIEDSLLNNNTIGGYLNYPSATVYKIPCKDGHMVEIPVNSFSEFWLHFGADTTTDGTFVPQIVLDASNAAALSASVSWTLNKEFNINKHEVLRAVGNNASDASYV